ncbi:OmpA family protein [Roseivirga sp. BDSF3-8]|uniref:OmpA family protein n=1 Tax=Roseivirga sp. BDSF3-8 TaxID=3241598 RepID=UPI00353233BB
MKRLFLLFTLCFTVLSLHAQDKGFLTIEAGTGVLNYSGDIETRYLQPDYEFPISAGLSLGLGSGFGVRLQGLHGYILANDRARNLDDELLVDWENFDRALNVRTEIWNASFSLLYYLDNGYILPENFPLSPYLSAGVGYTWFTPYADLLRDKEPYYYWSDNTVRLIREDAPDADMAQIVEQDGDYETKLRPLQTEGVRYDDRTLSIPLSVGLSWRISGRLRLKAEATWFFTRTDYLDDVSGDYATPYEDPFVIYAANPGQVNRETRGNPNGRNDRFYYTSVSLAYRFTWGLKKFKANTITPPPSGYGRTSGPYTENQRLVRGMEPQPQKYSSREAPKGVEADIEPFLIQPMPAPARRPYDSDTIQSLEYEIEKLELYNTLYRLRLGSPDPAISYEAVADSTIKARRADSLYRADFPIRTLGSTERTVKKRADTSRKPLRDDSARVRITTQAPRVTQEQIRTYEDSIMRVEQEMARLKMEDSLQKVTYDMQMDSLNTAADSLREEKEQRIEQRARAAELQQRRDSLQASYQELVEDYDAGGGSTDSLQMRIDSLQAELARSREQLDDSESNTRENEMLADSLQAELEKRDRRLDASDEDSARLARYREEIRELNQQLSQSEEEEGELERQIADLEDEIEEMRNRAPDSRNEEELDDLEEELRRLRRDMRDERQDLQRDIRDERRARRTRVNPTVQPTITLEGGEGREDRRTRREVEKLEDKIDSLNRQVALINAAPADSAAAEPTVDSTTIRQLGQLQQQIDSLQASIARQAEQAAAAQEAGEEPEEPAEEPAPAAKELPSTAVFFNSGSFALSSGDKQRIKQLADYGKRNEDINFKLHGYTDATGNAQQNLVLSQRRANAVQAELVKEGITLDRISVEYFGVSPNLDSQSSAYGRRVEILMQY